LSFSSLLLSFSSSPCCPPDIESGDVAKCSRESTCTTIGLLQPDEKNSDFASLSAFATAHARFTTRANDMWMNRTTMFVLHEIAALIGFTDDAKTSMKYGLFAIPK